MADPAPRLPARRTRWAWSLATFFGVGYLRPGPGTYGSAAALVLWYGIIHVTHAASRAQILATLMAALITMRVGVPAADVVARESGRKDPGFVVLDEVSGQLFALIGIPADPLHALLGLGLFRLFDILKPPPIRQLERLPGGTGIMLDDVAAGLVALACGHLLLLRF